MRVQIWTKHLAVRVGVVLGLGISLLVSIPIAAEAQNLARARLFRGGSAAGPIGGWAGAPTSVDTRVWPPGCGVKQSAATPGTTCAVPYLGAHPGNPLYVQSGMNGSRITFDGNGWDINFTATILGNPGFPVLIFHNNEDYGVASFGPGLGAGQDGTITFNATGVDPATLGTQDFTYDPEGLVTPAGPQAFRYPPNLASTTPRPDAVPPNHNGVFRYVTGPERFGGTLNLTGSNNAYVVLTFNPGVATTGSFPVLQSEGTPIPLVTPTSSLTIPGATLINRKKGVEVNRIFTSMGITPGGFVDLGTVTQGSTNAFAMRESGPFTTGMVTVTNMSRAGVFPTTTTRVETGSKNTVSGVGTIQLVKPFIIRTKSASNGGSGRSFTTKVVLEVPEPGSLLLLASGLAGMVGLVLLRRRTV